MYREEDRIIKEKKKESLKPGKKRFNKEDDREDREKFQLVITEK